MLFILTLTFYTKDNIYSYLTPQPNPLQNPVDIFRFKSQRDLADLGAFQVEDNLNVLTSQPALFDI